jgi:hypothetical protein
MSDGQNSDDVSRSDEAIQRDVTGLSIRNDELSQPMTDGTAEMGMLGERVDRGSDRPNCGDFTPRSGVRRVGEDTLQVADCVT